MKRRGVWVLGILVLVLVTAYFGASRRSPGPPLDPTSTSPDGAKAVVELVDRLGGEMALVDGVPGPDVDVALVLEDRLPREQADDLEAWVRRGGVLVVADPNSLLTPRVGGAAIDTLAGGCAVPGLENVREIDVGVSRGLVVEDGADACFTTDVGEAFLVVEADGGGITVALGGPDVFTNALLDEADNAVLAGALLSGEGRRAAFVRPTLAGGGDRGLVDLVGTPVRAALIQLVIAFGVVVAWRARRLGRPVTEPQPVRIRGAELTDAVGRLLRSNRRPDRAAAILRDRARRDLSPLLGLPLDATSDVVEATLVARTTLTDGEVRRAVSEPVTTDDGLVAVAHLLARIREELSSDRIPV